MGEYLRFWAAKAAVDAGIFVLILFGFSVSVILLSWLDSRKK